MTARERDDGRAAPRPRRPEGGATTRPTARIAHALGPLLVGLVSLALVVAILLTMYELQVRQHDAYTLAADRQHFRQLASPAERGTIYDRQGDPLALTRYVYTIGLTPRDLKAKAASPLDHAAIVAGLAELLELPLEQVEEVAAKKDATWVLLKQNVRRDVYDQLISWRREHGIGGIAIDTSMQRYYPEGSLASSVIGFTTGREQMRGVTGIEAYYDAELAGRAGYRYTEVDNYGASPLPYAETVHSDTVHGAGLVLHLDRQIQSYAQTAIDRAVTRYQAQGGGVAIVMDPRSGAVLAMAQSGAFDLNAPFARPASWGEAAWEPVEGSDALNYLQSQVWQNRAIRDGYEPGSTYKALTAAMALDLRQVEADERFSDDPIWVEGWTVYPISCSVAGGHGERTLEEGLCTSCNPVFVQLAQRIGIVRFYDYVRAFGHRQPTGIDLPGEATGIIHAEPLPIDMAVWSFGEQATVTPLQMISAFAALGNDGMLMRPQMLARVLAADGNPLRSVAPEAIRRVVSPETSREMLRLLRAVVHSGTGEVAEVPGYQVAGKTSTSTHGDDDEFEVVSFAALAPAERPRLAVLTILYEPQKSSGSWPAQIANREIMEASLERLGQPRSWRDEELADLFKARPIRDVVGQSLDEAVRRSPIAFWEAETAPGADLDAGLTVRAQYPPPGTLTNGRGSFYVSTDGEIPVDLVEVPDFAGMGLDEARREAARSGLNLRFEGDNPRGTVQSQQPAPTRGGEAGVQRHSVIALHFG